MQSDVRCAPSSRGRRALAPGPRGHWLTGSLTAFRRDPIGLLGDAARQYGDLVRFRFAHVIVHLVNHPDLIRHVLVTHSHHFDKTTRSVASIRAVCGDSLLTSEGAGWQTQRRLIQPAFQLNQLQTLPPLITDETQRMLTRWRVAARQQEPVDIVAEMMHLVYGISARAFFGSASTEDAGIVERALRVVLDHTWLRLQQPIDWYAICPWLAGRSFRAAMQDFDRVVYRIIESRRRSHDEHHDLLSYLQRREHAAGSGPLTAEQLRNHVLTMLLTGHETTANLLAWAFLLVAAHPATNARISESVRTRPESGVASDEYCERNTLIQRVLKETLRLYPSIWIMERRVRTADELGGYRLAENSTVVISPYVLHRHPAFWSDPDRFDPDHFLSVPEADQFAHAYMPFGAGPHQCVGQHMAMLIASTVLQLVLSSCHLRTAGPLNMSPLPGITLRHRQPQRLMIEFRKTPH